MSTSKIAIGIFDYFKSNFEDEYNFSSSEVIPSEKIYFNTISPQKVHVEVWFLNVGFNFF